MSQTIGGCIRLAIHDREYHSNIVVMTSRDIWALDGNPEVPFGQQVDPEEASESEDAA